MPRNNFRTQTSCRVKGSLAYDLRCSSEESAEVYSRNTDSKVKKEIKARAGMSPALFISLLLCTVLLYCAVSGFNRVIVLSDEVYCMQAELSRLGEEQKELKILHGNIFSPAELERYALEELGMKKPSAAQIVYVEISNCEETKSEVETKNHGAGLIEALYEYFLG